MLGLIKIVSAVILAAFFLLVAYHFTAPEKGLLTGSGLRLRIASSELLSVVSEDVQKSYDAISKAPGEERLKVGMVEMGKLRDDFVAAYNKGTFLSYLARLKTLMAEISNTIRNTASSLPSAGTTQDGTMMSVNLNDFGRSARAWITSNEKRLAALTSVFGDNAEEQIKSDLAKIQIELTAAIGDLDKKLAETGYTYGRPRVTNEKVSKQSAPTPNILEPTAKRKQLETKKIPEAPPKILALFLDRYGKKDVRQTPYYFSNIKIIKSANAASDDVYCITFQADVYHKHDNKRWDKSPLVLNVIAAMQPEGVMATYENFAPNPLENPRDGACVKPTWGVHDYKWDEVCPYGCMSSQDISTAKR